MEKRKILIADDEQVIRELFVRFLDREGYQVAAAKDGLDASERIEGEDYDIVILDLKMPGADGMNVVKRARDLGKDPTVIIITGHATIETAKDAMKQGCFDYITKPFDMKDMISIVKRALDSRAWAEEKKGLEEQLRLKERLASLAEMGAGVAHEINTVNTSVKLFLEMLEPGLPESGKEREELNIVLNEVRRAGKMISRFLNFTKPDDTQLAMADINQIIKKSLDVFRQRLVKQEINVSTRFSGSLSMIACDPIKMEEVFLNIFSNSIDAMAKGGKLCIRTQVKGEKVAIEALDTGIGIPAENLSKVYTPFFTTKASGTGLGLSIAHRIIDEHKGVMKIYSRQNKWTLVRIELPISVT